MKVAEITRACYPLVKGDGRRDRIFIPGGKNPSNMTLERRNEEHTAWQTLKRRKRQNKEA